MNEKKKSCRLTIQEWKAKVVRFVAVETADSQTPISGLDSFNLGDVSLLDWRILTWIQLQKLAEKELHAGF